MRDITEKEFHQIRDYIKRSVGISLGEEKKSLIYSRLRSTLQEKGFDDFSEYYEYLINDKSGDAVISFINKVTTNHTFFMREVDHFDFFRDTVLPYIAQTFSREKDLRLWCAGCSSGEEPYTLQMIIQDFFRSFDEKWNTEILATDISSSVLQKATKGAYTNESISPLPESWRKTYFEKLDDTNSVIVNSLKKEITFRKFNLMEEKFPFKRPFQVIFCRNVMIYFDNETRNTLVEKFYQATEQGGYLFIGHSESLNHTPTAYKYVMPAVYRKV
ncbi:MAG: protein-glutamate O-methyltransferase CheR [Clostridiales bacterium]|jgi:chemotaxis protein methyltransferase CheR|nr:protein-glutamate O-methyltransferase CheR [Clostridiales bacterium]